MTDGEKSALRCERFKADLVDNAGIFTHVHTIHTVEIHERSQLVTMTVRVREREKEEKASVEKPLTSSISCVS